MWGGSDGNQAGATLNTTTAIATGEPPSSASFAPSHNSSSIDEDPPPYRRHRHHHDPEDHSGRKSIFFQHSYPWMTCWFAKSVAGVVMFLFLLIDLMHNLISLRALVQVQTVMQHNNNNNKHPWNNHDLYDDNNKNNNDGIPRDLYVRGKLDHYDPVPESHQRKAYVEGKGQATVERAFHNRGWIIVDKLKQASVFYRGMGGAMTKYYQMGQAFQVYSRLPAFSVMESKDGFLAGFRKYQQRQRQTRKNSLSSSSLYFLPETFRLSADATDRQLFTQALQRTDSGGALGQPWVLKNVNVNNGLGIEMLGPHSTALKTIVSRVVKDVNHTYIVQRYICNELTWFQRQKFDLRMYWLVASVDPWIVLHHDGLARVSRTVYQEAFHNGSSSSSWDHTASHLTNHGHRIPNESNVSAPYFWQRVREHYAANRELLSKRMPLGVVDPVQHVRNQMKEAIGTLVSAFRDVLLGASSSSSGQEREPVEVTFQNLFGFYGSDFIVDADLDVWFVEVQAAPSIFENYQYRVDMFNQMFGSMVDLVDEINTKKQVNATANLLPLQSLGNYELVYAGDWQYQYKNYTRDWAHKKQCVP